MRHDGLFYYLFYVGTTKFKRVFWTSYVVFYMIIILLCKIIFDTFYPIASPIIANDIVVEVTHKETNSYLTYSATYTALYPIEGTINIQIVNNKTHETYEVPGMQTIYTGVNKRHTIIILPSTISTGRYTIQSWLVWRPQFSISNHHTKLPSIEFSGCETRCNK